MLAAYAGWNLYRQVTAGGPDPVTVSALVAGLTGLSLVGWVYLAGSRAAEQPTEPSEGRAAGGS